MRPVLLGLTGLYCAGKNYAAALLEKRGIPVLDVDKLGYEALEREKDAVVRRFGEDTLTAEGFVDRRLLGEKVFGNLDELAALEAIVHPAVNALTSDWIAWRTDAAAVPGAHAPLCVINAALLHRCAVFSQLAAIIIIEAPLPVRLFRAWRRDRLSPGKLLYRFARQREFSAQYLTARADIYIMENSGFAAGHLEKRLDRFLAEINTKFRGV
jgi:dephospho-CoA kinase